MKLATAWWGIHLLAETKDDESLLMSLKHKIGDKTNNCYEVGSIQFVTGNDDISNGFSDTEIKAAKCVLQIER